jgi:hypothetical protein
MTEGSTIVVITPYEDLVGAANLAFVADNAINIAYDDASDHLLLLNNEQAELARVAVGEDGVPIPDTLARFDINHLGLHNADGMSVDRVGRRLFILDSGASQVVSADLDNPFNLISKIDLSHLGAPNLRGIAVHLASRNLFVVSPAEEILYELTQSGELVNIYDLAVLDLIDPRGLAFGLSADLTDGSNTVHLFMADSNLPDGGPANTSQPPGIGTLYWPQPAQSSGDVFPGRRMHPAPARTAQVFGRILELALDPGSGGSSIRMITVQVAGSEDDAEEKVGTHVTDLNSTDLELIRTNNGDQIVGIRFRDVGIPAGATIVSAYIEFEADEPGSTATSLIFHGEATDDAAPFAATRGNISSRSLTLGGVTWSNIPAWNVVHEKHRTSNLTPIVQKIVNRRGWSSGNAIAFIISGTGRRTAEAYDGGPARAPWLIVEYTASTPIPTLMATPTQTDTPTPTHTPTTDHRD